MDLSPLDWEYVEERAGSFVGREWVFARVRSFLSGPPGTFLLRGDPGTGKTAVAARLAQASCGRVSAENLAAQPARVEGTISAAVFCRAGKATVLELVQQLSRQLANSVDRFSDALQSALTPEINVGDVHVEARDVRGDVTGVRIVLNGHSDERAFSAALAVPLRQLRELDAVQRIVLMVDAVDEAVSVGEVNIFSRLLGKLDGVHLIVTCRRDARVLTDFKNAAYKVDLVADAPPGDEDLHRYVQNRLRGQGPEGVIARLASRVVREAADNFLYAFYVTGALAQSGALAGMDEETARSLPLPTGGLPGVYEDFLDRQIAGNETRWAGELRPVLAPLCVALGDGFTTEQLAAIASRLTGREFSSTMVGDVTRHAGQYLDGPHPNGPFRVYHESFARFLTDPDQNPNWPIDLSEANNAVIRALIGTVPEGASGATDWTAASIYVRRHLAAHAAAAGNLDDLLLDPGYLLAADPARVLGALPAEAPANASPAERAFRRAARHLQTKPNPDRASYLSMAARQVGMQELADQIDELNPGAQWSVRWTKWNAAQIYYLDSRYHFDEKHGSLFNRVSAVAIAELDGRAVVAAGCGDGGVRVLDMVDGTCKSEFKPEEQRYVAAMATVEFDGRPVVVVGYADGTLRVTDMAEGTLLRKWQFSEDGSEVTIVNVITFDISDQTLVAACTNNERMRFWDLADGTLIATVSDNELDMQASAYTSLRSQSGLPPVVTASEPEHPYHDVTAVTAACLDDRPVVVSGHHDGTIYVSDLATGESVWSYEACLQQRGLGAYIDSIAVYEFRGRQVIVAGGSPGMIGAWDLANGTIVVEPFLSHKGDAVRGVAIAELEGRVVMVAGGHDRFARVWDTEKRTLLDQAVIDRGAPFVPLAVGRPEGQLVIVSGVGDGLVAVWRPSFSSARTDGRACGQVMPALVTRLRPVARPPWWRLRRRRARAGIQGDVILSSRHYDDTQRYWWLDTGDAVSDDFIETSSVVILTATGEIDRRQVAASGNKEEGHHLWRLDGIPPLEPEFRDQYRSSSQSSPLSQLGKEIGLPPRPLAAVGKLVGAPTVASVRVSGQRGGNFWAKYTISTTLSTTSTVPHPRIPPEPDLIDASRPAGIGLLDGQLMAVSGTEGGGLRLWKWCPEKEAGPEVTTFMTQDPEATAITLGLVDGHPVTVWAGRDGIIRVASLRDADRAPHLSIELEPHIADVNFVAPGQLAVAGKWGIILLQLRWPEQRSA